MNSKIQRRRPNKDEYYEYYDRYVGLIEDDDIIEVLENQKKSTIDLLVNISESKGKTELNSKSVLLMLYKSQSGGFRDLYFDRV